MYVDSLSLVLHHMYLVAIVAPRGRELVANIPVPARMRLRVDSLAADVEHLAEANVADGRRLCVWAAVAWLPGWELAIGVKLQHVVMSYHNN